MLRTGCAARAHLHTIHRSWLAPSRERLQVSGVSAGETTATGDRHRVCGADLHQWPPAFTTAGGDGSTSFRYGAGASCPGATQSCAGLPAGPSEWMYAYMSVRSLSDR